MPATTPTGVVKSSHGTSAKHFDAFLETVNSIDLEALQRHKETVRDRPP